ncbi:unnamed protein product [Acanthoscelides obtectus]|uniref:Uncharacterized protein n=1 Tax=Acanthoscelides obtectus TaxID=200917 RepID=A0A9P0LEU0_ACAOB|nr:unnamed protein product [Acanthoscelides obtectus]CAK1679460.1 hypothetical protein AOBTE_LOCUS32263 [Acanthoscelides obtectus]
MSRKCQCRLQLCGEITFTARQGYYVKNECLKYKS